jgi:transcriptional regulator with XRE-family HTH domain
LVLARPAEELIFLYCPDRLVRVLHQEVILMARKPTSLGEKLRSIRLSFGLSQNGILRRLGLDELTQAEWSAYERGVRIPSLPVLLMAAYLAGVWMDVLVHDDLDLPESLPAVSKSGGVIKRARTKVTSKSLSRSSTKHSR